MSTGIRFLVFYFGQAKRLKLRKSIVLLSHLRGKDFRTNAAAGEEENTTKKRTRNIPKLFIHPAPISG